MHRFTRAVLARITARRAESAGEQTPTPRWKRYAAATVPLLLAGALAATLVLSSDARTQPTSAGQTATEPAGPQQAAATPQPADPAPAATVAIPSAERQQCLDGAALTAHPDNPALADDCALLLAAKDTLRGTATLNWSAQRAITRWDGVRIVRLTVDEPKRVTSLDLSSGSLNGSIPAALSGLSALRELRLSWNRLTGSIPPELGQLTQLTYLGLAGNRLSGAIPPQLGSIGGSLQSLVLSGPQPLPSGIGLTGAIPPQLGDLSGLKYLYLDGNRLTGSIPTRLRWLTELDLLQLSDNQLSGAIPTQLGDLARLRELHLDHNQLSGAIPTQLAGLRKLHKLELAPNSGLTGCLPSGLDDVRFNDVAQLNLPDCPAGTAATPVTPLPTFTLTVTAGAGGSVEPAGATTHEEDSEVTLTASWNDATTEGFAGWGGDCAGTATTCVLTIIDTDKTVTATFTALPADRCSSPTDADCIRAVYKGAPGDYAQVQDIPDSVLIQPDADGRYQVERGQQITVVTAAPLPTDYTRFYLQRQPLEVTVSPTSSEQLIPPVGTTYTFTATGDDAGSNLISFDLTAARPLPRPGQKPELGDVVVTTNFLVPTLRYDTLDIIGAATTPGSYAFLDTAGDASSAIGNYGSSAQATVELRIHPTDASGASRADFYDTVQIGDMFDYRTNGLDCGFRFTVTSIAAAASTRSLGLEYVNRYGGNCGGPVTDPGAAKDVYFVWRVPHGVPAPDGVRRLLNHEPTGKGTYRLHLGSRYMIDVPAGSLIVLDGLYDMERDPARPHLPSRGVLLIDPRTHSALHIDPGTGKEFGRFATSPAADLLFDQIMASIRYVE